MWFEIWHFTNLRFYQNFKLSTCSLKSHNASIPLVSFDLLWSYIFMFFFFFCVFLEERDIKVVQNYIFSTRFDSAVVWNPIMQVFRLFRFDLLWSYIFIFFVFLEERDIKVVQNYIFSTRFDSAEKYCVCVYVYVCVFFFLRSAFKQNLCFSNGSRALFTWPINLFFQQNFH